MPKHREDNWVHLPDFKSRHEAAAFAVEWTKENPDVWVSVGGPMFPVPPDDMLEILEREHGVTIKGAAACDICNYEDVFAGVVNVLLSGNKRWEAGRCFSAYARNKKYNGYFMTHEEEEK